MKTIALIEIGNDGHRTAYMQQFVATLLLLNHKVLCLIPDYKPIQDWIELYYPDLKQNVYYNNYFYTWDELKLPNALSKRIQILTNWFNVRSSIIQAEKRHQINIDFVFFNYIDFHIINYLPLFMIDMIINIKWAALFISSGMYRVNKELLVDKVTSKSRDMVLTSKNCVALAIHDEGIIEKLQNRIGKKVLLFPEIADLTPPDFTNQTYTEIKQKANQRIVVGTIGLEVHKCGYEFLQLAKIADPSKFFFVFAGIFHDNIRAHYTVQQLQEFDAFFSNLPENCYTSFGHINEGSDYNSLFCSFDIVNLLYKQFFNASNRLTKAAFFNKLVLSTPEGCIGEDVMKYNLGETANENNIKEQYQKLEILRNKITIKDYPIEQWKIYSGKHSTDKLKEKFIDLLALKDHEQ
jgi:hypothetical protein